VPHPVHFSFNSREGAILSASQSPSLPFVLFSPNSNRLPVWESLFNPCTVNYKNTSTRSCAGPCSSLISVSVSVSIVRLREQRHRAKTQNTDLECRASGAFRASRAHVASAYWRRASSPLHKSSASRVYLLESL
jgi:hypothetical protein